MAAATDDVVEMEQQVSLETTGPAVTAGHAARVDLESELEGLLAELTTEEKVALVVGADMWSTTPVERIGLRAIVMSDGPVGVRGTGGTTVQTSAMMPAPSALAATWDLDLARRTGLLFAAEARRHDVDVVLAPQINLQRTPVGGRHFECYSEDPYLTAEIATVMVRAAQERGVGMCVKHYVANDSETERTRYLARVDERTLREVYLAPFERVVHGAGAWSVMGAYSGVDTGGHAAPALEHRPLLTGVLKDEWDFDGLVVSDWVATQSVVPAVRGGLDLQMPGPDGPWGDGLLDAVRRGEVAETELDDKVRRILRLAHRVGALTPPTAPGGPNGTPAPRLEPDGAAAFLRELAARSVVVLKDDEALLPLDVVRATGSTPGPAAGPAEGPGEPSPADRTEPPTVALLGPAARDPFLQGGGSSFVVPDHRTNLVDELRGALGDDARLLVHDGARSRVNPPRLDVAGRCTDPVTGAPGVRLEQLAADGTVLATRTTSAWDGWDYAVRADAAAVRLRAVVDLDETGEHELGLGTVGVHEIHVDGRLVSRGGTVVNEDIILSSGHNHPAAATTEVVVGSPRAVEIDATLQVVHSVGYDSFVRAELVHRTPGPSAEDQLAEAIAAAAEADVAVVVVGTTEEVESEGYDRPDLDLPGNQNRLVELVLAVNPRTIVVVNAGAPVILPWYDDAPTVLWAWLAGQEAGTALADVLLGVTEPSGRLPWTLPARAEDVPVPHAIPEGGIVDYTEGLDVGYRGWERAGLEPAAPFGHGLGWSTWEYVDATVHPAGARAGAGDLEVLVSLRNTGPRASREVVQVYVEPPAGSDDEQRPVRWLGGFAVADVGAGEGAVVRVPVPARALQIWDTGSQGWVTPPGVHRLRVGRSLRDLRLDAAVPQAGR